MNAQEAIGQVEELIGYIEQLNKYSNSEPKIVLDEFIEIVNPNIMEALAIVLESAKLFHSGEPEEGPHYYYFDGWHVRKDGLPKIGVYPEGADE